MSPKEDLFQRWLGQKTEESKTSQSAKNSYPEVPEDRRPSPTLNGKLADYLHSQERRKIALESYSGPEQPWTISDAPTRAAVAMALILASHLTRFAGTSMDDAKLDHARDSLMHMFGAKDAVRIEAEAYDLLSWFAGAMNPDWRETVEPEEDLSQGETSEDAILRIISDAIAHQYDLEMRYYTGSRGAFSTRRITPQEIIAEKYLVAFCHTRQEKRIFRLTRIVKLTPVDENSQPLENRLCYPSAADTRVPELPRVSLESVEKKHAKSPKKASGKSRESEEPKKSAPDSGIQKTLF